MRPRPCGKARVIRCGAVDRLSVLVDYGKCNVSPCRSQRTRPFTGESFDHGHYRSTAFAPA
jgi:hypothetical protein